MMSFARRLTLIATLCCLGGAIGVSPPSDSAAPSGAAPTATRQGESLSRVLVTNDDGIESPGLHALAAAFAEVAEVTVVAPAGEASGTGMYSNLRFEGELTVHRTALPDRTEAWAVEGYPVDCVIFATEVLYGGEGPDLVVSGINTSPNVGGAFRISGTIAAARIARQLGYPAIAVSGGSERIPGHLEAGARYAVALAGSEAFAGLGPSEYVTLDIPLIDPAEFSGVRVARHFADSFRITFADTTPPDDDEKTYRAAVDRPPTPGGELDVNYIQQGYIVVVPMTVEEQVDARIATWIRDPEQLPGVDALRAARIP